MNEAGSSAQEIGTAMQKASASAEAAGVSFEWLGSYIATISEATRQNAESIGTAMTTLMSRIHAIRTTGYNSEDDFGVNDIAKALKNINVSLFDSITGEWRDVSDIFSDIAAQWNTLDDRTKSYIATVMAGTRQQNYFLALMQDMAKGAQGGSRAFELYADALEAAGTTTQSYEIYTQSLSAAQDEMTANLQKLYSLFVNDDFLRGMYNMLSNLASGFVTVTQATQGWNVKIVIIAASSMVLVSAINKIGIAFKSLLSSNPVGFALSIVGIIAEIVMSLNALNKQAEKTKISALKVDYDEYANTLKNTTTNVKSLISQYEKLGKQLNKTQTTEERAKQISGQMSEIIGDLISQYPQYGSAIDSVSDKQKDYGTVVENVNGVIREQLDLINQLNRQQVIEDFRTGSQTQDSVVYKYNQQVEKLNDARKRYYSTMNLKNTGIFDDSFNGSDNFDDFFTKYLMGDSTAIAQFARRVQQAYSTRGKNTQSINALSYLQNFGYTMDDFKNFSTTSAQSLLPDFNRYNNANSLSDYLATYQAAVDNTIEQIAQKIIEGIDTSGYTAVQVSAIKQTLVESIKSGFSKSGYSDIGLWISNWISHGVDLGIAQSVKNGVDKQAFKEMFVSLFGQDYAEQAVSSMIVAGINSDMFKAAIENAAKFEKKIDISDYIVNGVVSDDFSSVIKTYSDYGQAAMDSFVSSFSGLTDGQMDTMYRLAGNVYNFLSEYFKGDESKIANIWDKLQKKKITPEQFRKIAISDDIGKALSDYLKDQLDLAVKSWGDYLDEYVNNSSISTKDKLDFADRLLGDLSNGSLKQFIEGYNTFGKQNKNTIQGILGIDDDTWSSIVEGTATIEEMTAAIMKARAAIQLGGNEHTYLGGLADAFDNAEYGGAEFISSSTSVVDAIDNYRKSRESLDKITRGKGTKQDKDMVISFLKLGENYSDWSSDAISVLETNMEKQKSIVEESFKWLRGQIDEFASMDESISIDWDDIMSVRQLSTAGKGMVSYLAQLYTRMYDASIGQALQEMSFARYFEEMKKGVADTDLGKQNMLTIIMEKMTEDAWDQFVSEWDTFKDDIKDYVGDEFYTAMEDGIKSGDINFADAMDFLNRQFASMDIGYLMSKNLVVDGLDNAFAAAGQGAADYGSTIDGVTSSIEDFRKAQLALERLLDGGNNEHDKDVVRSFFSLSDSFTDWQSLSHDVAVRNSQIIRSFSWMREQIDLISESTVDWDHKTETTQDDIEHLAETAQGQLGDLARLYVGMMSGNAIRADMFDNLIEDIQYNTPDTEEGSIKAARMLMDNLAAESFEAFKSKWGQYKSELQSIVGDDFYRAMENGTLDYATAIQYLNKQVANFDLNSLENQRMIVDGLSDAYNNASYGGKEFAQSANQVANNINEFRNVQRAYKRIMNREAIKNDKQNDYQLVNDFFGYDSDDMSVAHFSQIADKIYNENERIGQSFRWVKEQINVFAELNGLTVDFNHLTETTADDIDVLAVSGKGMLSYLAQLYTTMASGNVVTIDTFKNMLDTVTGETGTLADTVEGQQAAITMLMTNLTESTWEMFKLNWNEYASGLQSVVGETFYNAMENYMKNGGDMFDFASMLNEQFMLLDISRMKDSGRIISEIADDITNAISGDIVNGDSAKSAADTYMEQFYAYLAVAAGDRSTANLSTLGLEGATESMISIMLPYWDAILTNDLASFENTVDYMWSVVAGLTDVQIDDYEALSNYALNAQNSYSQLATYLLTMINLFNDMAGVNPFISLFKTIGNDSDVTMDDQIDYLTRIINLLADGDDESYGQLQQALEILRNNGQLEGLADALGMTQDELISIINSVYDAAKASDAFNSALTHASKKKNGFANIYKNIESIRKSADAATKSLNMLSAAQQVQSASNTWDDAVEEYYNAVDALSSGGELADQSMSNLASALGTTEQQLRNNWSQVPRWMQDYVKSANQAISELNDTYVLEITGMSSADFSNLINGCLYVETNAMEAADELAKLGNFEIDDEEVNSLVDVLEKQSDGSFKVVKKRLSGNYKLLRPTGSNPLSTGRKNTSGSGGGSGGGGGSSDSKNGKSAEELFVERVEESIKRVSDRMSQLNTQMSSWDSQGFYTAEIDAIGQINSMLEEQNEIYRTKIAQAQAMLPGLYQELNQYSFGTSQYDEVLDRVAKIQDAIVSWGQALTESEQELIANKKRVKELNDQIRQLEIDLENEILQAIEDRQEKQEQMLQSRIDMEETIIEILKEQAEDAEQAILDAIDAQIDALNKEKDAISDLLDQRKEEAEEEDKLVELRKLEAKYSMISVDPTRAKEAKELMQEISDLRDEIAWEAAQDEAEQQQSSIDQQISSLQDYRDYIEKYYEDLLNNPKNFIDQVNGILKMSQQDILAWLSQNSSEYKNSTESTQQSMLASWTETLNGMYGIVETHWEQVADIIAQGEDYVIEFLKQNSSDYAAASKLQQEAYLEGWFEMFDNLEAAYKKMQATITDTTGFVSTVTSGVSDSSSGGGGSGSSGSSKGKYYAKTGWKVTGKLAENGKTVELLFPNANYGGDYNQAHQAAVDRMNASLNNTLFKKGSLNVSKYKRGGYIDYTGLAQVDGTRTQPEYMLNASQTRMMERLVSTLEMATIKAPSIPAFDSSMFSGKASGGYTFNGGINISVESLEDDADFEAIAERVKESIVNAMTHGKSVGF